MRSLGFGNGVLFVVAEVAVASAAKNCGAERARPTANERNCNFIVYLSFVESGEPTGRGEVCREGEFVVLLGHLGCTMTRFIEH